MTGRHRRVVLAFGIDLAATLVFVLAGRGSHDSDASLGGVLTTWWPFVAALAVGWLVTTAWREPFGVLWPGVGIWVATVIGGMLLRAASGQGTAVAFVVVATVTLALLLLGWRGVAALLHRRRTASAENPRETERYS